MSRWITRRNLRGMAWELGFCVVLPCVVLLSADVVAQKTANDAAQQQTQQQSDDQIAEAINNKLMSSNALRPLDLGVWVHDGVVTLSGAVPSSTWKKRAEALVDTVPGVKSVDDQIVIGAQRQEQPAATATADQASQQATPETAQQETPAPNTPSYSTEVPPSNQNQNQDQNTAPQQMAQQPPDAGNDAGNDAGAGEGAQGNAPANLPPPRVYNNGNNGSNGQPGNPAYAQNGPPNAAAPPSAAQMRSYQRQQDQPLMTIAQGTPLHVQVLQTLDSHHTKPGDDFRGVLAQNIVVNGVIAVPGGASIEGTVIDARPPGHLKGSPKLALQLSNVNVGSASYVLTTQAWARQGPGKGGQTAGAVAGGAAFGAIAGAIVGGGPVALLGAAIGGLGGAGLSALTPGAHILVPAESVLTFRLTAPLVVREPTVAEVRSMAANAPPARPVRRYPRRAYYPYGYPYPPPPPPAYYYPY
ncbi:MAG TPA: BON domain-containing protein [Acidobacteriaceae bacterium]|nr:BON domain-containing protein [Acidobacteriaceae bacterium]